MAVERTAKGAALVAVVGNALGHQQAADIGVAETQRAVLVGLLGDLLGGELRHHDGDLKHDGPQPDRVLVVGRLDLLRVLVHELEQVQRGEVAGRIIQEHVLRARIGRVDATAGRARVPVVHGGVEVQAGIGGRPSGVADLIPKIAGLERLVHLAVDAADQVPVAVGFHGAPESVAQRNGVVGVLARDSEIGFGIPVRVVGLELDVVVALARELDDALDVVLRHLRLLGGAHFPLQRRVLVRIEAVAVRALAVHAGLHDRLEVPGDRLGTGDEGRDLLFLVHLPV